jgi:hypothetical protein
MQEMAIEEDKSPVTHTRYHPLLLLPAKFFSYLFHPVFIPVYVTLFLMYWHPLVFAGVSPNRKVLLLATITLNCTLFPLFTVFLAWRLKFVQTFMLQTRKDRIIPYALAMIFYFWCWYVLKNQQGIPSLLIRFLLGSFVTVIIAWIANIYFKISMHGLAIGGMAFFVSVVALQGDGSPGLYLAAAWMVLGIVGTSRLISGAHHPFDIYAGIFLGMLAQLIAMFY